MFTKQYKTIYSIGCFDQFHRGHINLLNKMLELGDELIIGVHDDSSIERLKKLSKDEHDSIYTRMENVSKFAKRVFIVPDTNPTECLKYMVSDDDNFDNACYIRGEDMVEFPGKKFVESRLSIHYIPYTVGISATQLRNSKKQ